MSKWLKSGFAFSQFLPGILLCLLALSIAVMADELKIDHIRFEGNTAFSNKSLREILKAEEGKAFNSKNLKLDEILIANYYTQRGYLDVFVSSGFKKNGNKIDITYRIREGTRKFLKEISIQGNTEASTQGLRNFFKIREGDPFSRTVIEDGLNRMEDYYLNNGKPYALFADTTHFENDSLVVYRLKIHEGPTVYIKEIRYSGRERVKHFLMRREMAIAKGDKYARRLIEKSQSNLYSTGLFRSVEYRIVPLTDDGTEVLLQWKVREKKARWVGYRFGVGYEDAAEKGNLTTFDVTLEGGHRNLFGT
ncbi:MAG TPA: POTRA domain-containing protein, partial [Calditrichia bacterium]|nr:POTRA domain-containing protein [Calditrichia bacterium]